jgi:hypothetical protein
VVLFDPGALLEPASIGHLTVTRTTDHDRVSGRPLLALFRARSEANSANGGLPKGDRSFAQKTASDWNGSSSEMPLAG